MTQVSKREIIDVVKFTDDRIIIVEKIPRIEGGYKTNYFILNLETLEKEVVTKNAYLIRKFGNTAFEKISESIANYVDCEAAIFPDKSVFIIFSNGQCALFDREGTMLWSKTMTYKEKTVTSLAPDGNHIWCCCAEEDCVIRYLLDGTKLNLDLRIGSKDSDTFASPRFVSSDSENIYVCCADRVRTISRNDFIVGDINSGIKDIKRYYRFGKYSLICTANSAYLGE